MANSEPKMKTLYVNGIAVGEVPATGDPYKDAKVAQQFLKDAAAQRDQGLMASIL